MNNRYTYDTSKPHCKAYADTEIQINYFKAYDVELNLHVLLIIYQSKKPPQVQSLLSKIYKIKSILHPNLTQIYEVYPDLPNCSLTFTTTLTEGGSLLDYLDKKQRFQYLHAVKIIMDVYEGLEKLHGKEIIHNFVNLQNIQIDKEGVIKLSLKLPIYKNYYLSPETKEHHKKSKESDLFSLGVCLYKMIYGSFPFKEKEMDLFKSSVSNGCQKKKIINDSPFEELVPPEISCILDTLLSATPSKRNAFSQQIAKIAQNMPNQKQNKLLIIKNICQRKYLPIFYDYDHEDQCCVSMVNLQKKKIVKMDVIKSTMTEFGNYIEQTLSSFKLHPQFSNIIQYFVEKKDLVIIYEYCHQGTLKHYGEYVNKFTNQASEITTQFIIKALSKYKKPYNFLTNQQIFLRNGKLALKYPPFLTQRLKQRIKFARNGRDFLAPEVALGKVGSIADSWSVGVLNYWMKYQKMPVFDDKTNSLLFDSRSQMSKESIKWFSERIEKDHLERNQLINNSNNLQPWQQNSLSKNEASLQKRHKDSLESISDVQFRKFSGTEHQSAYQYNLNESKESIVKVVQKESLPDNLECYNQPQVPIFEFQEEDCDSIEKLKKKQHEVQEKIKNQGFNEGRRRKSKSIDKRQVQQQKQIGRGRASTIARNHFPDENQTNRSKLELPQKLVLKLTSTMQMQPDTLNSSKSPKKEIKKEPQNVSSLQKEEQSYQSKFQIISLIWKKIESQSGKLKKVESHWTKPIRLLLKAIIAIVMYIFLFYYLFLKTNGEFLQNKSSFNATTIVVTGQNIGTISSMNYTLVTQTPTNTSQLLSNSTLLYVRDKLSCISNTFSGSSSIIQIINTSGFAAFQIFGFFLCVLNLLALMVFLIKLDLPKSFSLINFQDKQFTPLYSWVILNLGISSLTSLTFLIYGGFFNLMLDPCLTLPSKPALLYIFQNQITSFAWKYCWAYLGIILTYVFICFFAFRPSLRLDKKYYIVILILYLLAVGIRALGSASADKESVFGVCGQLLSLAVGIPLLIIDYLFYCKISGKKTKIVLNRKQPQNKQVSQDEEEVNKTENNIKV